MYKATTTQCYMRKRRQAAIEDKLSSQKTIPIEGDAGSRW